MEKNDIKKIVVVDDTKSITYALGEWLKDEGFQTVDMFEDPQKAVEEIKKNGAPDLIITDYNMPGMNGLELLNEIDSKGDIRAIIMTANPSEISFKDQEKKYEIIEKRHGFIEKIINKIHKIMK